MLDLGLVVVGVRLGTHTEGVGFEAGVTEYCVVPTHRFRINYDKRGS